VKEAGVVDIAGLPSNEGRALAKVHGAAVRVTYGRDRQLPLPGKIAVLEALFDEEGVPASRRPVLLGVLLGIFRANGRAWERGAVELCEAAGADPDAAAAQETEERETLGRRRGGRRRWPPPRRAAPQLIDPQCQRLGGSTGEEASDGAGPFTMVSTMDTPRLTHVRVNVTDLSAAIEWYERLFGVPAEGHWPPEAPTYAHFTLGPAQFALGRYDPAPAIGARFNFEVDDVDAWWARVSSTADVIEHLLDTAYGTRKFTICDLDGNELGFVQAGS
jgi:predicted enzyme related to lactoylglutathione lyase